MHSCVIWRNTTQFGKYRTVNVYAETAGVQLAHRADADVAMLACNGLRDLESTSEQHSHYGVFLNHLRTEVSGVGQKGERYH